MNVYAPKLHILDNECSNKLKKTFRKYDIAFQRVPPHSHRCNAAERAIQTWKITSAPVSPTATPNSPLPNGTFSCPKQTSHSIFYAPAIASPTSRPTLASMANSIKAKAPLPRQAPALSSMSHLLNARTWHPTASTDGTSAHPSSTSAATNATSPAISASETP